jgi:hypothetical protein
MHQRQQLVAQPQHRGVLDALDAVLGIGARAHQLDHRELRDRKAVAAGFHDQRRDDGERQRDLDGDAGALAGHRLDVDGAADLVDIGAHHVHADAAAGDAGDGGGGGEARREDELVDLRFVIFSSSASVTRPLESALALIRSVLSPRPLSAMQMMMWPPS